jgi:riboflavin synthase
LAKTNLSSKKISDPLNVEVDVLAKYVERLIARGQDDK